VPFKPERLGLGGFGGLVKDAGEALTKRKRNRLREALQPDGRWAEQAFVLAGFGGQAACAGCGKQPAHDEDGLCDHCETDLALGQRLPGADRLAIYDAEQSGSISVLGKYVQALRVGRRIEDQPNLVVTLDGYDATRDRGAPTLARYVCNYVPTWKGDEPDRGDDDFAGAPVTFEHMARRAEGRRLLAFLKADVDRLGEVFAFGLAGRDTASRVATMSRTLDLFFSGWLPALLEKRFPNCYSVYAGGDDLLMVGPWNEIIDLADTVVADFRRLTANPALTLSAGILLAKPGYPISRAATDADELLDRAKDAGRDRVAMLGHVLTWAEWEQVRALWQRLKPEADTVSTAFLYHLMSYARMWRRYIDDGDVMGLSVHPLIAYDVSRNVDARSTPRLHAFASGLTEWKLNDAEQQQTLANLGLTAELLILGRRSGGDR
jgi:CRISPR-associated protein Csm1